MRSSNKRDDQRMWLLKNVEFLDNKHRAVAQQHQLQAGITQQALLVQRFFPEEEIPF